MREQLDDTFKRVRVRKQDEVEPEVPKEPFHFDNLPVELKHLVLNKLKTGYLLDVCAKVSTSWEGMVGDLINQRVNKIEELIPEGFRGQLEQKIPPGTENATAQLLKLYDSSYLTRKFDLRAILVNGDATKHERRSIVHYLLKSRPCECKQLNECISRTLQLMPAMNLLIVQTSNGLEFFHMEDIERLNGRDSQEPRRYQCIDQTTNLEETWPGFENSSNADFSVFRDHVAVEERSRTVLLFKVVSCDHENAIVRIERVRRIHLPLWSRSLCLLEDKLYIVYTTGHIGRWSKSLDELSITDDPVIVRPEGESDPHCVRIYRVGNLVFIKSRSNTAGYEWYVHDPKNSLMSFNTVPMVNFITFGFVFAETSWECTDVFYIDMYCNFFLAHCRVQSLYPDQEAENRLYIRRVEKLPTINHFQSRGVFVSDFLQNPPTRRSRSVILNGSVISPPFLPLSLKPCQLETPLYEPVPVADLISVELPSRRVCRKRKLRVYRVRISNLQGVLSPVKQRYPTSGKGSGKGKGKGKGKPRKKAKTNSNS